MISLSPVSNSASTGRFEALRNRLVQAGFAGDTLLDHATRAAMSTDNSVYQIFPEAVLAPLDEADLCRAMAILAEDDFKDIPLTARGGGTGTNGQSLNSGIIIDMRRHMTRIVAIDESEGWVEVEPGVVLDELNEQLASTGLFFAPTTSTSNRCTIGGMVSTDASGKGSRIYGKTSDNVLGLRLALEGGRILDSLEEPPPWANKMLRQVAEACEAGRGPLLATVPKLSRRFSGYDLERALPDAGGLQWWRLVIGAEGTLGIVTRIRLRLLRRPKHKRLVVIAFDSFIDALKASPVLLTIDPLAIETIDEVVQELASRAGLLETLPAALRTVQGSPPVYNFVEFVGDSVQELEERMAMLTDLLTSLQGVVGFHVARDAAEMAHLWSVRASSVGLLGDADASRRPIPFVEDCVVPPERLVPFVEEFLDILKQHQLTYGVFGHIDVGCLHVRPALDLDQPADRTRLKAISDSVYAAVKRQGGIFWGEHGKGIRGQYLEDFVGPEAYAAFRRIKTAFDPAGRFNPHKLVAPQGGLKTIDGTHMRRFNSASDDRFTKAFECNGNAACLNYDRATPMCPSFKATADIRHSPKGRAEILRLWRERGAGDAEADHIEASVFEALDGCLGCNACSSNCPTHVDIPEMKSLFLSEYFRKHRRPWADLAAILLEDRAVTLSRLRPLLRILDRIGVTRIVGRMLGLVDLPPFSASSVSRLGYPVLSEDSLESFEADTSTVFILQDPFTSLFDVDAVRALTEGLTLLGYSPVLLPLLGAGKAAHVLGDQKTFKARSGDMADLLRKAGAKNAPIIGVDPAQTLMIRRDYAKNGISDLPQVLLVQEFLSRQLKSGVIWPHARSKQRGVLMLHCTEKSALPAARADWEAIMHALGHEIRIAASGCCGMAGLYGHQARHVETSRQLFDLSWAPQVERETQVYASGFSCRCQVKRQAGKKTDHPMEIICRSLRADASDAGNRTPE